MAVNILTFTSEKKNKYIFDGISNNIYSVDSDVDLDSLSLLDLGYESEVRTIINDDTHSIVDSVFNNAKTLIIEMTEQCNLRCSYCVYDEKNTIDRSHSIKNINIELLKIQIEAFNKRTNGKDCYIIFYGGEPLLAFNEMKDIFTYARKVNSNFKFSLTTNGYGLKKTHFDFFIENNFKVTISLDGNKETHDKYRLTKSKKGSFEKIFQNIKDFMSYNVSFFNENVSINCVLNDPLKITEVNDFFSSTGISDQNLHFSPVIQSGVIITEALIDIIPIISGPIERILLNNVFDKIQYRQLDDKAKLGKKHCIPFSDRTYIRTNGNIQFCERIGSAYKSNIDNLHIRSIEITNDYSRFKQKDCTYCFAYNFCDYCPASFVINSKFNHKESKSKCHQYRRLVKKAMGIYINEMEHEK